MATGLGGEQLWLCPSLDNVTPFNDQSGQGNNGTAQGGLSTVADTSSGGAYAYDFDGNVKYMSVGVASAFTAGGSYSISFWAYDAVGLPYWNAYPSVSGATRDQFVYIQNTNARLLAGQVNQSSSYQIANSFHTANQWTHVTVTHDSTSGMLTSYKNGVAFSSTAQTISSNSPTLAEIGRVDWWNGGSVEYSQSLVDDIRAYDRVLTQSEITHLATARGIEGRPFDGLGGEQLWLCPSLENSPNDLSGNNNNGAYQGSMGTIADTSNGGSRAYSFDGADDYIDAPTSVVEGLSTGAISMWFKADSSASGTRRFLMSAGSGAAGQDATTFSVGPSTLSFADESLEAVVLDSSQGIVVAGFYRNGESFFFDDSWHHVVYVSDSTGNSVYIDGVLVSLSYTYGSSASTQALFRTGLTRFYIGVRDWNGLAGYFDGCQDDIRVYNRVLTQSEISWLSTERGVLGTPPAGLGDEQLWLCPSIQDSANDISVNNNHGVYQGGLSTIADTGAGGSLAYNIDTTSKYVDCGNILDAPAQFSISAWVNRGTRADVTGIAGKWNGSGYMLYNSTPQVAIDGGPHTSGSTQLPASTWQHLAATYDGTTIRLYQDGVETSTQAHAAPSSTSATYQIGAYLGTSLRSLIDDVRQYDRVLTQSEISWLATERGVQGTPPAGLGDEQLWLCPSIQDSANDLSGNGNDGVIGSSVTTVADTSDGGTLAYNFPGTGGANTITINDFDLGGLSQLTWSAWIYDESDNAASTHSSFFSWRKGGSGNDDILFFNYERSLLSFQLNNGADGGANYTPVYYQNWKHYCVVFDGTNPTATDRLNLYVNGVLQTPGTTFSYPATTSNQTGTPYAEIGDYVGSSNYILFNFKGKQDDIRTYERALTKAEITHLASQRGVLGPAPAGLGDEQLWLCPSIQDSANDLSGNGNNGTYVGSMGTVADTGSGGSRAYEFDGINDYIECSGPTGNTGSFSLSLWASRGNGQSVTTTMAAQYDPVNVDRYWLLQQKTFTSGVVFRTYPVPTTGTGRVDSETTSIAGNGVWYHITALYDATAGEQRLYIDGVLIDSDSSTGFQSATIGLLLGWDGTQNWLGKMDDVRAYDRALTQYEITHLSSQRGVLGPAPIGLGDEQLWLCPSIDDSANDLSVNGNDGTYVGGMGTIADTSNGGSRAYDFDGVDDYINCGLASSPASLSMSVWVNVLSFSNTNKGIAGTFNSGGTSDEYGINTNSANSTVAAVYGIQVSNPSAMSQNTWHHLVLLRDTAAGFVRLYRDGLLVSETAVGGSTPPVSATKDFIVGSYGGANYFSGLMDDVRKYDRALTKAEITHLASQRGVLGPAPAGLGDEQLWLCPSIQDSANDLSGNNNHGTYVGGAGTISDVAEGGTRSYEFTNSSHYITGTTDLDTTDDFSLSYWYRSNTGNSFGTNYHIFRARNGTRGFNFYKYYSSGTQTYTGTTICRGGASSNSDTPVNYGITTSDWLDWHCFTMNWDNASSTMEYFIDGVSVGTWNASVSGSVDATGTTMILGALGNGTGTANGYIDDLRKYSRKLTKAEITHLATQRGVLGAPALPTGLGGEQLWLCPSIDDSPDDLSGNGNNGTYNGGMGTIADTSNGGSLAYDFDGTDDYIDVTGYANSKTAYSLSTWINGTGPNQTVVAFNVGDSSGSRSLNLGLQPSATALVGHQASPSYYWAESTSTVNGAGWKHVAATYDGSDVKIYVDGVLEDTQAAPNSTTAQTRAFIGRWVGSTPFWLTGKMDDIRAYNRVLTQDEITHLASQRGVLGSPATTAQYNAFLTHAFRQLFQTRLR